MLPCIPGRACIQCKAFHLHDFTSHNWLSSLSSQHPPTKHTHMLPFQGCKKGKASESNGNQSITTEINTLNIFFKQIIRPIKLWPQEPNVIFTHKLQCHTYPDKITELNYIYINIYMRLALPRVNKESLPLRHFCFYVAAIHMFMNLQFHPWITARIKAHITILVYFAVDKKYLLKC